jgi:hypothetical protein
MKSSKRCEHFAFAVQHEVQRLSKDEDSPVTEYAFGGKVTCYDCGIQFEPFRVRLKPLVGQHIPLMGLH